MCQVVFQVQQGYRHNHCLQGAHCQKEKQIFLCHGCNTTRKYLYVVHKQQRRESDHLGQSEKVSQRKRGPLCQVLNNKLSLLPIQRNRERFQIYKILQTQVSGTEELFEIEPRLYYNRAEKTGTFLISTLPSPSCGPATSPMDIVIHAFPSISNVLLQLQGESPHDQS